MSDTIRAGSELALEMAIHDGEGELLERTEEGQPFRCRFGESMLPPGVERELEGRSTGHEFDLLLSPADGFGDHDPAQVISIPRDELPPSTDVAVGDLLPVLLEPEPGEEGEEEEVELPVVAVDEEAVTVDLNHPYAGMRLRFSGRVVEVG
jgi:FKBP-type peptidyl-prolyl cis-trans isomerase SlyD